MSQIYNAWSNHMYQARRMIENGEKDQYKIKDIIGTLGCDLYSHYDADVRFQSQFMIKELEELLETLPKEIKKLYTQDEVEDLLKDYMITFLSNYISKINMMTGEEVHNRGKSFIKKTKYFLENWVRK